LQQTARWAGMLLDTEGLATYNRFY
jgi:hypothetical protein